ncbi:MAG: SusD/RagB family nutrient-binding outer membrane lipoprotein [Candidatus Egerieousia sp.]
MKSLKSIIIGGFALLAVSLTSCGSWLDCNVDPENPSSESATYQTRLPFIEFFANSSTQFAAWYTNLGMGDWLGRSDAYWLPTNPTAPYQWWFVGAAPNVDDMYNKAMAAEAWHYAGVAKLIRAYGFMLMTDLFGEMPYTDALGSNPTPKYDNGKTIYLGCLSELDEAIDLLGRTQDASVPSLAQGDFWNNGDASKWLKLAYLLKARYCVKLSKKQAGSYLEGKYDAATILDCLSKAQQSNADNTIINHTDDNGSYHEFLWGEPVDYSPFYSVCGMNGGYMVSKMLYDNLTNFAGYGVEDPRADKIIPWAWSKQSANTPAGVKFVRNWRRSLGVDLVSQNAPTLNGGPLRASFGVVEDNERSKNAWWIDSDAPARQGDTIYVEATSSSKGYASNRDLLYRRNGTDASKESGSFYSRVSSPTYVGTYAEACFIKAEVLFNQGNKGEAFNAYKAGIQAAIELMNEKLNVWVSEDASLADCPSFEPMAQADIDNFLNNGIGTAADLTLGKIMTQKRLALQFSMEIYNDMRRYDYDPEIFLGWGIPALHDVNEAALKAIPMGKQYRRWMHTTLERNYNSKNLHAIGAEVPGANMSLDQWNAADDVWTINVWWDSDQQ